MEHVAEIVIGSREDKLLGEFLLPLTVFQKGKGGVGCRMGKQIAVWLQIGWIIWARR